MCCWKLIAFNMILQGRVVLEPSMRNAETVHEKTYIHVNLETADQIRSGMSESVLQVSDESPEEQLAMIGPPHSAALAPMLAPCVSGLPHGVPPLRMFVACAQGPVGAPCNVTPWLGYAVAWLRRSLVTPCLGYSVAWWKLDGEEGSRPSRHQFWDEGISGASPSASPR